MTAIPDKTILNGSSNPTTAQFKTQMGQLWDYLNERNDVNATASGLKVSANKKLLGRNTSGAGAIEEITYTDQGYAMLTEATQLGFRNKIINGKMEISQRGVSFAEVTAVSYSLDRWLTTYTSTAFATVSQSTDVPSDNGFQNSIRVTITTAGTSIAAEDRWILSQRIEGYNIRELIGKPFTLSFRVRSSKTGTHCVAFRSATGDRSYIVEYTINAVNTWETKNITVNSGLITSGTWDWTTGTGLNISFCLAAGTTFQTTSGAWRTGNYLATANQVNCLDTIGNIFAVTGVQLEAGSVATPFEHRPYGTELALCQRYYQSYDGIDAFGSCTTTDATYANTKILPVEMRATPTVTFSWASGTGASIIAVGNKAIRQSGVHNTNTFTNALTLAAEL